MTGITIPSSVTSIGEFVFYGCSGLTSITIPEGVTVIPSRAFDSCTGLQVVFLPRSLTEIGSYAFYKCTELLCIVYSGTEADRANMVIGAYNDIHLTDAGYWYYEGAMQGTCGENVNWALNENSGLLTISGSGAMQDYSLPSDVPWYGFSLIRNVTIASGVTSVGDYAFYECSELTGISIPNSVTDIGYGAFYDCGSLSDVCYGGTESEKERISFDTSSNEPLTNATWHYNAYLGSCGENLTWKLESDGTLTISGSGQMTDYTEGAAPWYDHAGTIKSVAMDDEVTSIGAYAFYYCTSLAGITIPDSVTSIGKGAFKGCTGLTVTVNCSSYVLQWLKDNAVAYTVIHGTLEEKPAVDATCTESGNSEYYTCSVCSKYFKLDGEEYTEIEQDSWIIPADGHSYAKTEAVAPTCTESGNSEYYTCSVCGKYFKLDGEEYTEIEQDSWIIPADPHSHRLTDGACAGCGNTFDTTGMTVLTLPASLKQINASAFRGASAQVVVIPDGCQSVGSGAFADCTSLKYVFLPEGLTLPEDAFGGATVELIYR